MTSREQLHEFSTQTLASSLPDHECMAYPTNLEEVTDHQWLIVISDQQELARVVGNHD